MQKVNEALMTKARETRKYPPKKKRNNKEKNKKILKIITRIFLFSPHLTSAGIRPL